MHGDGRTTVLDSNAPGYQVDMQAASPLLNAVMGLLQKKDREEMEQKKEDMENRELQKALDECKKDEDNVRKMVDELKKDDEKKNLLNEWRRGFLFHSLHGHWLF